MPVTERTYELLRGKNMYLDINKQGSERMFSF